MWGIGELGCLVIPRFPLACELIDHPELRKHPVVVTDPRTAIVIAVSKEAQEGGVHRGRHVREAMAVCPAVEVVDGRSARYHDITERIVERLLTAVPEV